jgi:hypothetical protein
LRGAERLHERLIDDRVRAAVDAVGTDALERFENFLCRRPHAGFLVGLEVRDPKRLELRKQPLRFDDDPKEMTIAGPASSPDAASAAFRGGRISGPDLISMNIFFPSGTVARTSSRVGIRMPRHCSPFHEPTSSWRSSASVAVATFLARLAVRMVKAS